MSGEGAPVDAGRAARGAVPAVSAKRQRAEEAVEELQGECVRLSEEAEKLHADAAVAAAILREDAKADAAETRRVATAERAALDAEKAAMEKTYAFQTNIIQLDVGGHKFTTSLPTLTSVPDTYLAALFSGRHPLAPNAYGTFFIDRCGAHFEHILNYLRDQSRDDNIVSARHATDSPRHSLPHTGPAHKRERRVSVYDKSPSFCLDLRRMSSNSISKGFTAR